MILIHALTSFASALCQNKSAASDSTFKGWYYTPTGVFGRIPISKTKNRSFVKISRPKHEVVLVQEYNPAGIMLNSTEVRFLHGKLSLITSANRWGEAFDSSWFKPEGPNEFIVTEKLRGINPFLPCQAIECTYKNNTLREILCLMDSTKPGYDQDGVSHYVYDRYDDPQRFALIKKVSYFGDIDNTVMSRKYECHSIVNEYDKYGDLISRSIYGAHDEAIVNRFGYFKTKMHYDNDDNEIEIDYLDPQGSPTTNVFGYCILGREFRKGFVRKETYFNSRFEPEIANGLADSVAIIQHEFDENGNEREKANFNGQNILIDDRKGIHKTVFGYNASGMLTDISYMNIKSHFVPDQNGVYRYHYERNALGQMVSMTQFDARNMSIEDLNEGAYETKYTYDNWGRISKTSFWVNDSVKMRNKSGHYAIETQYDENGLAKQVEYLDKDGNSTNGSAGYSKELISYNDRALVEERRYFRGDRPAMLNNRISFASHYHSIRYSYDFSNRVTSIEYFDDAGKPINAEIRIEGDTPIKCQRVEYTYTGMQIASERLYDSGEIAAPVVLNCGKKNCLMSTGTGILLRNIFVFVRLMPKRINFHGIHLDDSLFFGNQLAFLNKDSVLIFLNNDATALSGAGCAHFYRIGQINHYYQLDGEATDFYAANDSIAARLTYEKGYLNGPCSYYYTNGNLKEKGVYKGNARVGIWDYFYETGQKEKKITFTDKGSLLIECYSANGQVLAQNGNGSFEGTVTRNNGNILGQYVWKGNIKDGLLDGEWNMYKNNEAEPIRTEKFSSGKFLHGTAMTTLGKTRYNHLYFSNYESIHPGETVDHYGQDNWCGFVLNTIGTKIIPNQSTTEILSKDFFNELNEGMKNILKSNKYREYAGWVFLDLKYDESGQINKKYVRLFQENEAFKSDILNMLDDLKYQALLIVNNKRYPYEKFYVVLVESNEVVIPEELIKNTKQNANRTTISAD